MEDKPAVDGSVRLPGAQVPEVLRRACEIEASGDYMTVAELRRVGSEAGIHPEATEAAIAEAAEAAVAETTVTETAVAEAAVAETAIAEAVRTWAGVEVAGRGLSAWMGRSRLDLGWGAFSVGCAIVAFVFLLFFA